MAIPTTNVLDSQTIGSCREMKIDLSEREEDKLFIIDILQNRLYSNKILALIREYSTNALDSHKVAGIKKPIKITLPNKLFPEFRVRDFGVGLSKSEFEEIFIKYGRSTKRNNNEEVGQFGVGCKSAFCYSESFLVISYHNGVKTTYSLVKSGECNELSSEETNETGIEIVIPIMLGDINEFQKTALDFFKYWSSFPNIIGGDIQEVENAQKILKEIPIFVGDNWEIRKVNRESYYSQKPYSVAVMGNVPYPINWTIIRNKLNVGYNEKESVLFEFISSNNTILKFNIGELDFSASRESLEYTEKTCKAIIDLTQKILDNVFDILSKKINEAPSLWEAKKLYNKIFGNSDNRLFEGDLYRIEKYYSGKFSWKGIPFKNGKYEGMSLWDYNNGYLGNNNSSIGCLRTYIMCSFYLRRERVKHRNPTDGHDYIEASDNVVVLINDINVINLNQYARYIFFRMYSDKKIQRIYVLTFKDDAQKKDFYKKNNFDSVPVSFVSDIKKVIKESRAQNKTSNNGITKVQQQGYSLDVKNLEYYNIVTQKRESECVDINNINDFYITVKKNDYEYMDEKISSILTLLSNIDPPCLQSRIYLLTEAKSECNWVKKLEKRGKLINVIDFIKQNLNKIIKDEKLFELTKFYIIANSNFKFYGFSKIIIPLLTCKNGVMYTECSKTTYDFSKYSKIYKSLQYFGIVYQIKNPTPGLDEKFFDTIQENIYKEYPMIGMGNNDYRYNTIFINPESHKSNIKVIADYVNMVDSAKNPKIND